MSDVQIFPAPECGDTRRTSRRDFLRLAGFSGVALMLPGLTTGCVAEDPTDPKRPADIDLSTDEGLLDFAWVAAQIKYEVYQTARWYKPYASMTQLEANTFNSFASHSSSYKLLFFRIGGDRIPEGMRFRFPDVDFSSRSSFYPFAIALEENLAAAFGWAVAHARSDEVGTLMGKMASVAGRHAAVLRDLEDIRTGRAATSGRTSFANDEAVSTATGLHRLVSPADVVESLRPYIITPISVRGV